MIMDDMIDHEAGHDKDMALEMYVQWLASKNMTLQDAFDKYLYKNYPIGNGEMLLNLYEDTDIWTDWLNDMGFPEETELF
jgi:hypothetical protein